MQNRQAGGRQTNKKGRRDKQGYRKTKKRRAALPMPAGGRGGGEVAAANRANKGLIIRYMNHAPSGTECAKHLVRAAAR
jgi:hypothetical protein